MPKLITYPLLIKPCKISWLRFILEGYDGLAILSTITAEIGLVSIQTFDCHYMKTMRLLEALAETLTPDRTDIHPKSTG
ncbi:DUF4911 domain-containing protein [Desulfobulbus oligotrophicus]|uniref:DUF4911 domain-containing protein n=1 Tax=Desulfobulbus oligotrophicus TaxID=1909699 RepID=A0A7T6AR84_9BACT|nr:DUF4911 domain-containing protein [Desulfobulbus oligotrophicus]QQG66258.1 DUF4911 domain-containing protein [Desulfobulbus oligotrophicus]